MNETTVTVVGTVCSEVRYGQAADEVPIARFQIRNTPRRYDKRSGTWGDGDPSYYSAVCWRALADHVASSMGVGDPVVATGRLRISRWRRGDENMVTAELDVQAIGHDLRWGTTVYRRAARPGATPPPGPGRRRAGAAAAEGTVTELERAGGGAEVGGAGAGADGPTPSEAGPGTGGRELAPALPMTASTTPPDGNTTTATDAEVMNLPAAA